MQTKGLEDVNKVEHIWKQIHDVDETSLLFGKDAVTITVIHEQQEWYANLSELVGAHLTTGSVNQ